MDLNEQQEDIVSKAIDWYYNSSEQVFQYSGAAGTGKSVVMNAIINRLGLTIYDVAPMSYIGAAAIVMRLKGLVNAKTIHSWLYEPKWVPSDVYDTYLNRPKMKLIFVPKELGPKKLICIDEAGCVPLHLKSEIESRGIKILACGDLNQLPPVEDNPAYLYNGKVHYLTQIMRQNENSAIVYLAQKLLKGESLQRGLYGDVVVEYEDELSDGMLKQADVFICGKNSTRDKYNKYIREKLYGFTSDLPQYSEKVVCRKNNWRIQVEEINLANGLMGNIVNSPDVSRFDGRTFTINFKPTIMNTPFTNLKCDYKYFKANVDERRLLKNDRFSKGEKFEYSYAITTHISQGSQFNNGIYLEEYLNPSINKNLNYTGITRFSNACVYLIHRKKYF